MTAGRARFGPVRIAWADAGADADASTDRSPRVLERLGAGQVSRHASLSGAGARRFLIGRALLLSLIDELTSVADLGFTTTCERCGADHGRPRLERAPVAVSVSYAGSMVAVAAVGHADADAVGVDIERMPTGGAPRRLRELDPLFAPRTAPDTEGWTLIEAALKADGRGMLVDLADLDVGAVGTGTLPGSRAVRVADGPGTLNAGVVGGPPGFLLSAAMVPAAGEPHPG